MIQFKKIVVTTDLSLNADAALPYAIELARNYDGTIYLLHVFEQDIFYASAAGEGIAIDSAEWLAAAKKQRQNELDKAAKALEKEGIRVIAQLRQGSPAHEIVNLAKAENADCIVISTHGRTGLSHLVFGSVAERVVRLSACPVLTVRPSTIQPGTTKEVKASK